MRKQIRHSRGNFCYLLAALHVIECIQQMQLELAFARIVTFMCVIIALSTSSFLHFHQVPTKEPWCAAIYIG